MRCEVLKSHGLIRANKGYKEWRWERRGGRGRGLRRRGSSHLGFAQSNENNEIESLPTCPAKPCAKWGPGR